MNGVTGGNTGSLLELIAGAINQGGAVGTLCRDRDCLDLRTDSKVILAHGGLLAAVNNPPGAATRLMGWLLAFGGRIEVKLHQANSKFAREKSFKNHLGLEPFF